MREIEIDRHKMCVFCFKALMCVCFVYRVMCSFPIDHEFLVIPFPWPVEIVMIGVSRVRQTHTHRKCVHFLFSGPES